jgi:WD40 repeat protein
MIVRPALFIHPQTLLNVSFCKQHDAQLDYYGKRLATCSSDRNIKVFDVVDGQTQKAGGQTLKGCASLVVSSSS